MKNKFLLITFILLAKYQAGAYAQNLIPISLDEKINNAALIVEGKVTHKRSFWNDAHTMIYTANEITLYKSFKGNPGASTIEVITMGGAVGRKAIHASDLLTLNTNDIGLFFCNVKNSYLQAPLTSNNTYDVFGSSQGFIAYDLFSKTATTPFSKYKNIQKELYQKIQSRTGLQPIVLNSQFDLSAPSMNVSTVVTSTISSFSPTTVNAGAMMDEANNLLTITGSGFGTDTTGAAVIFTSASNGNFSVAANSILVRNWTDNSITVRVPTEAGTGQIKVKSSSGAECISATSMQVRFSVLTADFPETNPGVSHDALIGETALVNGSTGYVIQLSNSATNGALDFSNATYRNPFLRALNTWRTSTGFRLSEGTSIGQQEVADDGNNMLMFDNSVTGIDPLPSGVLATTISYFNATDSTKQNVLNDMIKLGFDIIVRSSNSYGSTMSFATGPCAPLATNPNDYDLESILLHELGHALNLAHINDPYEGAVDYGFINPDKIMNATFHNGVRRTSLDQSAIDGANYCITSGPWDFSKYATPIPVKMVAFSKSTEANDHCPASFPTTATVSGTTVNMNLAYATSNKNEDPSYLQVNTNGKGTSITNNAFYPVMTGIGASLSITISDYTWENLNESSCPNYSSSIGSIPTKGTELVIYKTSTCPAGQNFPTPIAYQTFEGNGAITNIPNLQANTKYLIMVDGIENSKTSFGMTFTAAALPIKLRFFKGANRQQGNQLSWQLESITSIHSVKLERSNNQGAYEEIASWSNTAILATQQYTDLTPTQGSNNYRLAFYSVDGTVEYSTIVSLQNNSENGIRIFPNPAKSYINIELNDVQPDTYSVRLRNAMGQVVQQSDMIKGTGIMNKKIDILGITPGIYWIEIGNHSKAIIHTRSIQVQ